MMPSTVIYDGPVEEFTLMPWRQYVSDFKLALMHAIVFFGVRNYSQGQDILTCTLRMQSATRTGTGKSLLIYFRIVLGMLTSLNISTARFHKRLNHLRPRARIVDSDGHIESDVQTLLDNLLTEPVRKFEQMVQLDQPPGLQPLLPREVDQRLLDPALAIPPHTLRTDLSRIRKSSLDFGHMVFLNLPDEDTPEHRGCAHALGEPLLEIPMSVLVRDVEERVRLRERVRVLVLGRRGEDQGPVDAEGFPGKARIVVESEVEVSAAHFSAHLTVCGWFRGGLRCRISRWLMAGVGEQPNKEGRGRRLVV